MKEIIKFLKEIFMMSDTKSASIGLSQFKPEVPVEKSSKENFFTQSKNVKLSDLMRKSV